MEIPNLLLKWESNGEGTWRREKEVRTWTIRLAELREGQFLPIRAGVATEDSMDT